MNYDLLVVFYRCICNIVSLLLCALIRYFPTTKNRRANEIHKFVRESFTSLINERLEKRKSGAESGNLDLFDIFMEELYDEKSVRSESDRQIIIDGVIGQCKIFFFAGYETSANLLCWTMIMLSVHQNWQDRAREEARQVLGNKTKITSDDLSKLKIVSTKVEFVIQFRLIIPIIYRVKYTYLP